MTKITKRFEALLSLIDNTNCIADIGSDHGKFSKLLIESGKCEKVIATDISGPSLNKTKQMIKKHALDDKIECRLGDGLEVFKKNEVDIAVIAGVGGYEIIKILSSKNRRDNLKSFVLQPVQNSVELRTYLSNNNFLVTNDICVFENEKFYDILKVKFESGLNTILSAPEIWFGKDNLESYNSDFLKKIELIKLRMEKRVQYLTDEEVLKLKEIVKLINKFKGN